MDGFSYYNIFDTKGMEYIVIIAFLLLLIPFWLILNRGDRLRQGVRRALGVLTAGVLRVPQGIYHSQNHTWAFLERFGAARVGLDDLLMRITGEVELKFMRQPGETVRKGDLLAEIAQDGRSLKVYTPLSGRIVSRNEAVESDRMLLGEDPYGKGWLYRIEPADWKGEVADCYLAAEANHWLSDEVERYKHFVALNRGGLEQGSAQPVLQDGGELTPGSLGYLSPEAWSTFQHEFLDRRG